MCGSQVIDLGAHPVTVPGSTFVYWEVYRLNPPPPGVNMDMVRIDLCTDYACTDPQMIFRWGDADSGNNGSIPASYMPEDPAKRIDATDMFGDSRIEINPSAAPAGTYRYVRFMSPMNSPCWGGSGTPDPQAGFQVDSVMVVP